MKPTYEQLEQQLAAVISERDAAVNAERIWGKTMMEACGEDGTASVAAEIAALRAQRDTALESLRHQLAAVVAENAGLKKFGETLFEMHNALNGSGTGIQGNYEAVCQQLGLEAAMDALDEIETPATDAAIANIQAQGVEMFASHLRTNDNGASVCKMIALGADEFAAQLRQGAKL
ncbi:TPA: hypothetical protein PFE14_004267 [Kluyvera ascorbata]|nr:hypothetical protein [Kluyvera ascorbata]